MPRLPRRSADPRFPGHATRPWTWCSRPRPTCSITTPRPCRASTARCGWAPATSARSTCWPTPSGLARTSPTKSGLMLGLGETAEEVLHVMRDLRDARRGHPHARPIPAAFAEAPADHALRDPRGVRRAPASGLRDGLPRTSSRARWCAVPTTLPSRMAFRAWPPHPTRGVRRRAHTLGQDGLRSSTLPQALKKITEPDLGNCVSPENGASQLPSGSSLFEGSRSFKNLPVSGPEVFLGVLFGKNPSLHQSHQGAADRETAFFGDTPHLSR